METQGKTVEKKGKTVENNANISFKIADNVYNYFY